MEFTLEDFIELFNQGIIPSRAMILLWLKIENPDYFTTTPLAEIGVSPTCLSENLRSLERKGYVKRIHYREWQFLGFT